MISTSDNIETVLYTYTVTGPGPEFCTDGTTYVYTVNVDPSVTQTIANNDAVVCEGVGVDIDYVTVSENGSISLQASYPAGVVGSVGYGAPTVLGAGPGTIVESLSNATSFNQTVTYTFTASANSCADQITAPNTVGAPSDHHQFTNECNDL